MIRQLSLPLVVAVVLFVTTFSALGRVRPLSRIAPPQGALAHSDHRRLDLAPAIRANAARFKTPNVGAVASAGVAAALLVVPALTVAAVLTAGMAMLLRRTSRARRLRRAAPAEAIEVLAMLEICLAGGLGLRQAFSELGHSLASTPWVEAQRALEHGGSVGSAVAAVVRCRPAAGRALALVETAHREGAAVIHVVRRQRHDLASDARRDLLERAQRCSVLMLLPLVTCVLPALLLAVLVPIVVGGLDGATLGL